MIDIAPHHLDTVKEILGKHVSDCEVRAYGSRVTWTASEYSDLDLVVVGDSALAQGTLPRLKEAFDESNLPMSVDVLDWHRIPGGFRNVIEADQVVLVKPERSPLPSPDRSKKSATQRQHRWPECTWGELATLECGKPLRGYRTAQGPYRVFGTNGPIGWTSKPLCKIPGVIVGRKGAYRGIHYSHRPFAVIDTAFYLDLKPFVDPRWAYYELLTHDINSLDSGSAIPSTSRDAFYSLPVHLPPLSEQRETAHILGTLDDKIRMNRRLNKTMDAMMRALFESWFVDFDPLRTTISDGRSRIPKDVADLFPRRLVGSPIGDIPKGWDLVNLEEVITFNPPIRLPKGSISPYLPMVNMPTEGHIPEAVLHRPYRSGAKFTNGDTLLARITPCLENGKTAFVDFLDPGGVGWGSTEYIVMRPRASLPAAFAYCLARTIRFRRFAIQNMAGTSGRQRVSWHALSRFPVVKPPEQIAEVFSTFAGRFLKAAKKRAREAEKLASVRDGLLPQLVKCGLDGQRTSHQESLWRGN